MSKILKKATTVIDANASNKYKKYALMENPFPSMASVNESSPEKKYNGSIYEESIREEEFKKLLNNFLEIPQINPDHLRLGFLSDTSYIGRGNGKTSFLVNLMRMINTDYCLDISKAKNKCFSIYFSPDGGGAVKTFERFVDYFFNSIIRSNVIAECLAILRYEAISELGWGDLNPEEHFKTDDDIVNKLTNDEWFSSNITHYKRIVTEKIFTNLEIASLPPDFPLQKDLTILSKLVSQKDFENYFRNLRNEKNKLEFIFTHLVKFFIAAGFNGSYILVDDFERIPDFQSAMQKKDFAIQLRTVLFDGGYLNSKIGFYNFIIALHAGVPRLLQEAWGLAGMDQRVALSGSSGGQTRHIINFEKINDKHAIKLIKKYLYEYREDAFEGNDLHPFNTKSITVIANNSEMNISRILQNASNILEFAIETDCKDINEAIVANFFTKHEKMDESVDLKTISTTPSINLATKIEVKKMNYCLTKQSLEDLLKSLFEPNKHKIDDDELISMYDGACAWDFEVSLITYFFSSYVQRRANSGEFDTKELDLFCQLYTEGNFRYQHFDRQFIDYLFNYSRSKMKMNLEDLLIKVQQDLSDNLYESDLRY